MLSTWLYKNSAKGVYADNTARQIWDMAVCNRTPAAHTHARQCYNLT